MSTLKPCPFCGKMPEVADDGVCRCNNKSCSMAPYWYLPKYWNIRPIEDALNTRIAELEEKQRWIPVSERLPDTKIVYDKFDVIVEFEDIENGVMTRCVELMSYDYRNKSWNDDCWEFGFYPVAGVTHWRERPTPPEVQE